MTLNSTAGFTPCDCYVAKSNHIWADRELVIAYRGIEALRRRGWVVAPSSCVDLNRWW